MAATAPGGIQPGSEDRADDRALGELRAHRRRVAVRVVVAAVIVGLVVAFVVRNSQAVRVDLLFTSRHPRLIWVILTCFLAGVVVGLIAAAPARRGKRRRSGEAGRHR